VRSEQVLFDWKEGYCTTGWWKARRFCCTITDDNVILSQPWMISLVQPEEPTCSTWRTWADVFDPSARKSGSWINLESELVEYATYTCVAVCLLVSCYHPALSDQTQLVLALLSALLTIHLTASTSFVTRKDSGVLSPDFANAVDSKRMAAQVNTPDGKRQVMYYVS
jgi:chloride channel 3/4/5